MPHTYGYGVEEDRAEIATVQAVFETPIGFFDASNEYGKGESERRHRHRRSSGQRRTARRVRAGHQGRPRRPGLLGHACAQVVRGELRAARRWSDWTCSTCTTRSGSRSRRSPPPAGRSRACDSSRRRGWPPRSASPAVTSRRWNDTSTSDVFDVLLNHNRFTLLDQSASPLITKVVELGMTYLNAAPYASGLLAKPLEQKPRGTSTASPTPRW